MPTARIFAETLLAPGRGLAAAAERRSFVPPILAATCASLLLASALAPRIDHERAFDDKLERDPRAAEQMSPHDREVALAQSRKLGTALLAGTALVWPALRALAIACGVFVASRLAGARPPFPGLLTVASWGSLPLALKDLLSLPALLGMRVIAAQDAGHILPSSLAVLLPPGSQGAVADLAQALDLFSIWSLCLVALGAAQISGARRRPVAAAVLALWGSYALLAHVALPRLSGAGAG
jgi:hypothetical protein